MNEELRVEVIQAGDGRTLSRCVRLGEGGVPDWFLTGLCYSRAEFLSLLKNYNYFLKEQPQLQLSYAQVRLRVLQCKTTVSSIDVDVGVPPWTSVSPPSWVLSCLSSRLFRVSFSFN